MQQHRGICLPGQFGGFTTPGYFWRFFANPVITQFNVTGVRAIAAVNHGRDQTVAVYLICGKTKEYSQRQV